MQRKKTKKITLSEYYAAASIFCVILCLLYPKAVKDGALNGIKICFGMVIPSVFPMLILSSFAAETGFSLRIRKLLHAHLLSALGLGGECCTAVLTGVCGGYNVSAKIACTLYEKGKISLDEARRLAMFFTCPGLSFCINVAGTSLLNSKITGLLFFASNVLTCFITAFIFNLFHKAEKRPFRGTKNLRTFSEAAVYSVKTSSETIISISSWIIAFNAFAPLPGIITSNEHIDGLLRLVGEIASSIIFTTKRYGSPVTAACLYFGGLCVFLQQLPYLAKLLVKPAVFFMLRLSGGLITGLIQYLFTKIFSAYIPVFFSGYQVKIFSHNIQGGIALLILCTTFLVFVRDNDIIKEFRHKKCSIYNNRTCS